MRIIGIDSSCMAATVAVLSDDKLEGESFINNKLQHSVILFPLIEDLLNRLNISVDDVDAVAVSGGPGSFTGLRIGVAAAKGIAQGRNLKFVGVSSLDAIAFQQVGFEGIVCPILDALRDNVYTALYMWQGGEMFKIDDYDALHIDELIEKLNQRLENVMFCGDALPLHTDKLKEKLKDRAYFAPLSTTMPRAASIAEIGLKKINQGITDDIYTFSPIYIRKSQAEREYERKQGVSIE